MSSYRGQYMRSGYRRRGRRTIPKKVPSQSNAQAAWQLAKAAWKGLKYVKGLVNSEMYKYDQMANPDTALSATIPYQCSFVNIAQGDGDAGRTGNSILCKGLRYSFVTQNASTSPVPFTRVRFMILEDTQEVADSLYPTLATVLENVGEYASTSGLNSETVGRFRKLVDIVKVHDLVQNTNNIFEGYIKMNKHVRYNGTTANDIQKTNIFAMIFCDNTNGAFNNPLIHVYQARTYYHDN